MSGKKEETVNRFHEEAFEDYFDRVMKEEEEAMLELAKAYAETYKLYTQEEDEEYLENTRKLGKDKYNKKH